MTKDDMLDLIAQRRDFHIKSAADWLDLVQKHAAKNEIRDLSDASTSAERHNFAAHSFGLLLKELEG